ncbi:hypothetical protein MMC10_009534 [Thelotrema lepadinum]|nr:hypothetical protein [Thelotrema lepadinum]
MRVTSAMIATAMAVSIAPGVLAEPVAEPDVSVLNGLDGNYKPSRNRNPSNSQQANAQYQNYPAATSPQGTFGSTQQYRGSGRQGTQYAAQKHQAQSPQGPYHSQQQDQTRRPKQEKTPAPKQPTMMDKIKTAASLFENPKPSNTRTGSSSHRQSKGSGYDRHTSDSQGSKGFGKSSKSKGGSSSRKSSVSDPTVNVMDAFADLVNNLKDKESFKHAVKQIFNSRAKEGDKKSSHYHQNYEMVKMKPHDEDEDDSKKPKKKSKEKHSDKHEDIQEVKRSVTSDEELFTFDSRDMPLGAIPSLHTRFAEANAYPEADAFADPEAEAYPSTSVYAADPLTSVMARRALLRRALSLDEDSGFGRRDVEQEEEEDGEDGDGQGKETSGKNHHHVDNDDDDDDEEPRKHTAGKKGDSHEEKPHTSIKEKVLNKPKKLMLMGIKAHSDDTENGGHRKKLSKGNPASKIDDEDDSEEKPKKSGSGKTKELFEDDDDDDWEDEEDVSHKEHESLNQKPKESPWSKHRKPGHQHKHKPSRLDSDQQHHSNKLHFDRYGRPYFVHNDAKPHHEKQQNFQTPAQGPTRQQSNAQSGLPSGKQIKLVPQVQSTPSGPLGFASQQQQANIGTGKQNLNNPGSKMQAAAPAQGQTLPSAQRQAQPNQQPGSPPPSCNRQACDGCRKTPGIPCTNECRAC